MTSVDREELRAEFLVPAILGVARIDNDQIAVSPENLLNRMKRAATRTIFEREFNAGFDSEEV